MSKAKSPAAAPAAPVNRTAANAARRQAKAKAFAEYKQAHKPKVARGTKRAQRRAAAAKLTGATFVEKWAEFCKLEAERNNPQP